MITVEQVSKEITEKVQLPFQYFEVGSLLLINNSFGPDALQEYSVYKKNEATLSFHAVESLTVSWMDPFKLTKVLTELNETRLDELCPISLLGMGTVISKTAFELFKRDHKDFSLVN
ncbi:hypothetical protein [Pontibacillus halophilus]|uniref:hypothetical protein n=1 Tax=Pontibacillus halophilus TaxID=516704 RepID=UPI000428C073|nr:hypothetical protein [Pontibacillus halophilus]